MVTLQHTFKVAMLLQI